MIVTMNLKKKTKFLILTKSDIMDKEFVLSSVTAASSNELRSICANIEIDGKRYLAAGDRASMLHTFAWNEETKQFKRINSFKAHDSAVSAIAYLQPCEWMPEGALVTSSLDKLIYLWPNKIFTESIVSPIPIATLVGHENNVCFLTTNEEGMIISSSWDGTARVWSNGNEIIKMSQDKGIWGVVEIPMGYATLGADKSIRIYDKSGKEVSCKEDAHTDVVRAGLYIPDAATLVTAANDGTIREWFIEEDGTLTTLEMITVTDTYLYSLVHVGGMYIAGSEDKCAYVVDSDSKVVLDVLPVPGVAWAVAPSPNGVAVTATDGFIYDFSIDKTMTADEETVQRYIAKCASLTFNNPEFDQINILDLRNFSDAGSCEIVPGRFELMREGEEMVLVVHNLSYGWMKVGTLTKSKGSQAQKVVAPDGQEYDFCFTVDVDESGQQYPLYLNYNTNPYTAAMKFIQEHELQMHYLDTIANFIIRNLKGQKVEMTNKPEPRAQQAAPKSYFFPIKEANFISSMKPDPIIAKIRKSLNENNQLSEEELTILGSPLSEKWVEVATQVLLMWEVTDSWPVLDIFRAYILDENAKKFIPEDFVVTVIEHFAAEASTLPDYGIMGLMRVIGNLQPNYSSAALTKLDIPTIFETFIDRINTLPKISQIPFTNAIMNFTMYGLSKSKDAESIVETLVKALSGSLDDEARYRALLALGNAAQLSTYAKNKLLLHPEVLDATDLSERCAVLIEEIVKVVQ